jgi:hypothetical protein
MPRDSLANIKMFSSDDDADPSQFELPDVPDELDVPLSDPPYEPKYVTGYLWFVSSYNYDFVRVICMFLL